MKQFTANVNRFRMTDRNIILKAVADSGLSVVDEKLSVNENVLDKIRNKLTADDTSKLTRTLGSLKQARRKTLKLYLERHRNKVPHKHAYNQHCRDVMNKRLRIAEMQALATAGSHTVHPNPEQRGKYLINWVYDYWPSTGTLYNYSTQRWHRVLVSLGEIPELRI